MANDEDRLRALAEGHLRTDIGSILTQMIFQLAFLKAERDLREEQAQVRMSPNDREPAHR